MPTQEERLTTLEQNLATLQRETTRQALETNAKLAALEKNGAQFKSETVTAYQDMAMQVAVVKGLTETTIGRLAFMQQEIHQRFNLVDQRLDTLETRLDTIETQMSEHKTLLTEILTRLPEKP